MKKIIWIIVILLIIWWIGAVVLDEKKPVLEGTIKIGATLPLTGKVASLGENLKKGIDLGLEEVNKKYSFDIDIVYEDTQSKTDSTVSAVRKLIDFENVKIILGPARSSAVLAVAPITETNKVILFTPIASSEDISNAGDYVFRNKESAKSHGKGMAEFLAKMGISKVALFTAKSANSVSYGMFLKKYFEDFDGQIIFSVEYDENNTDFRTDIAKAINSGAEAFYIAVATGKDGGILARQIRENGFEGLITGGTTLDLEEFFDSVGLKTDNVFITSSMFDINDPDIQDYRKAFREKYNEDPDAFSANAYDAINLIAMAVEECGGDKADCIRDYLYNVKDYHGAGGLTSFDENGDVIKPVMIKMLKNGKFIKYEE